MKTKKLTLLFAAALLAMGLSVQAQMPCNPPSTLQSTNVTANSARLSWSPVINALAYVIRGQELGANHWRHLVVPADSLTSRNIFGLQAGTSYHWQVASVCDTGMHAVSAFSVLDTFTTLGGTSCDAPDSIWTSNISATSATLNWSAVAGASQYQITGTVVGASQWITVFAPGSMTSRTVNGLQPGLTYVWTVKARCIGPGGVSASPYADADTFSTPPNKLSGQPMAAGKEAMRLAVYPNPAKEKVQITVTGLEQPEQTQLEVVDATGRRLLQRMMTTQDDRVILDLGPLSHGVYSIVMSGPGFRSVEQLVVTE